MKTTFTVPGKPQPKQRARKGRNGWYTPTATLHYERSVAHFAGFEVPKSWPLDAQYGVSIEAHMPDKRRRDLDNVSKSVLDGLNGVLWDDDTQVVQLTTTKALDRANPRTVVTVWTIDEGGQ